MEYYKNLSLENLFYINDNGLVCQEEWKDIPNYKGIYQASSLGRIKSLSRVCLVKGKYPYIRKDIILRQSKSKTKKYYNVTLTKGDDGLNFNIHQLIAMAFLNHTPCGMSMVVNHKNLNKLDNRAENFEIITSRENTNRKHLKSSSQYTGVIWHKHRCKWQATIVVNGINKYLGIFSNEEDASICYENALIALKNNTEIVAIKKKWSSQYKGVNWREDNQKWIASMSINRKSKYIGSYITEIEASNAYQNAILLMKK